MQAPSTFAEAILRARLCGEHNAASVRANNATLFVWDTLSHVHDGWQAETGHCSMPRQEVGSLTWTRVRGACWNSAQWLPVLPTCCPHFIPGDAAVHHRESLQSFLPAIPTPGPSKST
ncbi:hypothetical protein CcaCcLH18_14170 [Colletotrichum camelliae]|nr:hypothetical protein CcaCcLH18_14170 [Colletotrichum camelliae]